MTGSTRSEEALASNKVSSFWRVLNGSLCHSPSQIIPGSQPQSLNVGLCIQLFTRVAGILPAGFRGMRGWVPVRHAVGVQQSAQANT